MLPHEPTRARHEVVDFPSLVEHASLSIAYLLDFCKTDGGHGNREPKLAAQPVDPVRKVAAEKNPVEHIHEWTLILRES